MVARGLQAMTPLAAGPGGGLPARPPRPTLTIIVGSLTRTVSDSEDSELTQARRDSEATCNLAGHRTRPRMCGWRPRRRGSESRGHLDSVISAGKSESPPPVERCFCRNPREQGFSYGNPLRMLAVRFTEKSRSLRVESEGAKALIDRSWNLRETGPNKHAAHPLSVRWALPMQPYACRWDMGHGPMSHRTADFDTGIPEPGPGEALIKVNRAGVCSTDLHILNGYVPGCGHLNSEFHSSTRRVRLIHCRRSCAGSITSSAMSLSASSTSVPITHRSR
jgi:hypothetical protein